MKHFKLKTHLVIEEIFQFSLVTYLLLLLAETLQEGFVSYFFNLNILLGVVLVTGIVMVFTHSEQINQSPPPQKLKIIDVLYILMIALGAGFLVYYKTKELGQIAIIVAVITGVLIILLSLLIFLDHTK